MAAVSRIQDEVLQCTICYDTFQTPKTLPCLHTFCEHCLNDYITGLRGAAKDKGFTCPVCREFIKPPDPKQRPNQWAASFRTNFHLRKLMKAIEEDESSADEKTEDKCQLHPQKELDLYCVACEKQICHLCAGVSHRGCSLVVTLEEVVSDNRVQLEMTAEEMNAILEMSRDQVSSAKHQVERLDTLKSRSEDKIRRYADALVKVVREKESELLGELDEIHTGLKERVELRIDDFREHQKAYKQTLGEVRQLATHGTSAQILAEFSKFEKHPPLDLKPMKSICDQLAKVNMNFLPGLSLRKLILSEMMLGEIQVRKQESTNISGQPKADNKVTLTKKTVAFTDDQQVLQRSESSNSTTVRRRRSKTLTTPPSAALLKTAASSRPREKRSTKTMTIPCKHRADDNSPRLTDIVVLPREVDGSRNDVILVTDWNNQCVKAYRTRRDRDSRLPLGGKPWCITALSQTSVAVSIPLSQQICVLKVGLSLMLLSSVVAEKRYSGLAALDQNTLIASGGSVPPSVDIIHVSGQVLQSFSQAQSSIPLFDYPSYVTSTPNGHILVSDRDAAKLTCMSRDGNVLWCFQPKGAQKLINPAGVYCDSRGEVLLVENRGLLRLSAEGDYLGVVLRESDGVIAPKGVWSRGDGTVYVTQKDEEICVYSVHG